MSDFKPEYEDWLFTDDDDAGFWLVEPQGLGSRKFSLTKEMVEFLKSSPHCSVVWVRAPQTVEQ